MSRMMRITKRLKRRGRQLLMRVEWRVSGFVRRMGSMLIVCVVTHHKVKGVLYEVINDEIEMEEDPKGEAKVDAKGNLLGGQYFPPPPPV